MALENCLLLTNSLDLKAAHDRMMFAFGESALTVSGAPDAWQAMSLTKRKLFSKATVNFEPLDAENLDQAKRRISHVYRGIPAENMDILNRLLVRIGTSRLGIDVQAPNGFRGLEEGVFAMAEALDAIIFWHGSKMLDKKGHLVMDFEGRSGVSELPVVVSSEEWDAQTPKTESGAKRKERTEAMMKERKIPFAKSLPPIEGEEIARFRSLEEVAGRALALQLVAVKAEGLEDEIVRRVMEDFSIEPHLSPAELAYINGEDTEQQTRINMIWRYESLWALLWALGHIEELPFPDQICDVPRSVQIIQAAGSWEAFLAQSQLRSPSELLDQCDLALRLHWAVVNARLRGEEPPAKMEAGVVYERHYAFNWLRCFLDQDWDDVETHT